MALRVSLALCKGCGQATHQSLGYQVGMGAGRAWGTCPAAPGPLHVIWCDSHAVGAAGWSRVSGPRDHLPPGHVMSLHGRQPAHMGSRDSAVISPGTPCGDPRHTAARRTPGSRPGDPAVLLIKKPPSQALPSLYICLFPCPCVSLFIHASARVTAGLYIPPFSDTAGVGWTLGEP